MNQRSEYLVQLLEKIGAPLMAAITDVSARQPANESAAENADDLAKQDAGKIAELLAKSVQLSIDIGKNIDLAAEEDQGESIRVALAALAGPLVAGQYRQNGQAPSDSDLKRITTALQAIITFSENFAPSADNTQRLKELEAEGRTVDVKQSNIQYIQAFIPVVNAIGVFSFGQPEQKLIQEISDRLTKKAMDLRETIFANSLSPDEQKFTELALLRGLTHIYSECHIAETNKLMALGDQARTEGADGSSMEPVWNAFDVQAAMLETLGSELVPQDSKGAASQAPTPPPKPAEPVTEQAPPAEGPPPAEPTEPAAPPPKSAPATEQASANPMSMFAKPKEDSTAPPPEAAPESPPAPPTEQAPPPAETQAPPTPPADPPPTETPPSTENKDGSPMSFFKSPGSSDKKQDEE